MKYLCINKKLKFIFNIKIYCKLSFHTKIYYEFHIYMQINLCQNFELKYDKVILNIEFITNSM